MATGDRPAHVSTGTMPPTEFVDALLVEAWETYRGDDSGDCSDVYPALGRVPRHMFGLCLFGADGRRHSVGDADVEFTLMSVAKPFVFALVCDVIGPDHARDHVGVNATGRPFSSVEAVERADAGRTNPMVNPGAIATTGLVPGDDAESKWHFVLDGLSRFAGRELLVDEEVYASASATNHHNRAIVDLLAGYGRIDADEAGILDVYTRQSSLRVTANDLAVMGATLADGGVNPLTRARVVSAPSCRATLAVMATAGLYETSGDWLYEVGLPGKSGIGGGIVTVSPGKGALGTFAPLLDTAGNSVKGQLAARHLSRRLGLDLFQSAPLVG